MSERKEPTLGVWLPLAMGALRFHRLRLQVRLTRHVSRDGLDMRFLELIFVFSTFFGSFWTLGVLSDVAMLRDLSMSLGVILAAIITLKTWLLWSYIVRRCSRPLLLKELLFPLLGYSLIAYVCCIPVYGVLVWLAIMLRGASPADNGELITLVALSAFWLPMWIAPALGAAACLIKTVTRED